MYHCMCVRMCAYNLISVHACVQTTIVREIPRVLARRHNVCIVDTSNEIAGAGTKAHECVGKARRMMVGSVQAQASVMVECVQNHTPHVMVIDEIGRPAEVEAARTIRQRGVRMIASAHGSFRSLMKNRQLRNLLGEVVSTIKKGGVPHRERVSDPAFDVVIEVHRASYNAWTIVPDTARAADNVIADKKYFVQHRKRDVDTGMIFMELDKM